MYVRPFRPIAMLAMAVVVASPVACVLREIETWRDQLVADSPCYDVNILDGIDAESTSELHSLFACLNKNGDFDSLAPTMIAIDLPSPSGRSSGLELASTLNALPDAGVDIFALAGVLVDALKADDRPIDEIFDLLLEWVNGHPASEIRAGSVSVSLGATLDEGIVAPLAPIITPLAETLAADNYASARFLAELLSNTETHRWLTTADRWASSTHPTVKGPAHALIHDLGAAILTADSPNNDRWSDGTGNSLLDLLVVFTEDRGVEAPLIETMAPYIELPLEDVIVRTRLTASLQRLHEEGHLDELGEQLSWMAGVDRNGGHLATGEISALHAFLRLLHDTNQPMSCSLDLWVTDLNINLGNMAVTILEIMANSEPETIEWSLDILADVMGFPLSEWILNEVADSGICPALTPRVMDDISAIDVLQDPRAQDLLVVMIELFDVLHHGKQSHLKNLADAITILHASDAVPPLEEAIRDLGHQPILDDLITALPVLISPTTFGFENDTVDLQDVLDLLLWVVDERTDGTIGYHDLDNLTDLLLTEPAVWTVMGNFATLAIDDDTQTNDLVALLPRIVALDPEFTLLDQLSVIIGDEVVAEPALYVLGTESFVNELLATEPASIEEEVPLAFMSRLILDGTLDDILRLIDLVLGQAEELE